MSPEERRRVIAIHEGGHVIVGAAVGRKAASLMVTAHWGGNVRRPPEPPDADLRDEAYFARLEAEAVSYLGGEAAEIAVFGSAGPGCGPDRANAREHAGWIDPDKPTATYRRCEARALAIARKDRRQIERIADYIAAAGNRLGPDEIEAAMRYAYSDAPMPSFDTQEVPIVDSDYTRRRRRIFEEAMRDRPDATEAETAAAWQAASEAAAAGESGPPLDRRTEPVGSETRVVRSLTDWYMSKAIARGMLR